MNFIPLHIQGEKKIFEEKERNPPNLRQVGHNPSNTIELSSWDFLKEKANTEKNL